MTYEIFFQNFPNLLIVVVVFALGVLSPGPATLMITGTAMSHGRVTAVVLSLGIVTGSMFWAVVAASGFVAALASSVFIFTAMKILGALYLLYLAYRSLRSAMDSEVALRTQFHTVTDFKMTFFKGLFLHLTNPKAPLVWMATLSIGLGDRAPISFVWIVIGICFSIAVLTLLGYAVLFSTLPVIRFYAKSRRLLEALSALMFGAAAIKILTSRVN